MSNQASGLWFFDQMRLLYMPASVFPLTTSVLALFQQLQCLSSSQRVLSNYVGVWGSCLALQTQHVNCVMSFLPTPTSRDIAGSHVTIPGLQLHGPIWVMLQAAANAIAVT